jgi:anti-anti-sigma regulatory factor
MLRVSEIKSNSGKIIFQLEGKIMGCWVDELLKECKKTLIGEDEIVLDLTSVSYIDEQGIYALKSLEKEKVKLINCSLFLSALLTEIVEK